MYIFHITTKEEWDNSQVSGVYKPINYALDGFIHCSFGEQVMHVADRFYADATNLILLRIESALVGSKVVEENLEGGTEMFPHIYGPLPIEAVNGYAPLTKDSSGHFLFPAQLA
jgi:uncharacterized protein (DUF952 family)